MPTSLIDPDQDHKTYDQDADERYAPSSRGISAEQDGKPTDDDLATRMADIERNEPDLAGKAGSKDDNKERSALDNVAAGWKNATEGGAAGALGKGEGRRNSFWGRMPNKTKAKILGGLASAMLGIGGIGVWSTPSIEILHIMHYAEVLKSLHKPAETQRNHSISKFYRSMHEPGNPGRTRLSMLQDLNHNKLMANLESKGIKFTTDPNFGRVRTVSLDPNKFERWKGLSDAEIKADIKSTYGVDAIGNADGGKIRFNLANANLRGQEVFVKDLSRITGKGWLSTFLTMRHFRAYFNIPDLLHPWKRTEAKVEGRVANILDARRKKEAARTKKIRDKINKGVEEIRAKMKNHQSGMQKAAAGLMVLGVVCTANDLVEMYETAMETGLVEPGIMASMDGVAMSDQIKDLRSKEFNTESVDNSAASMQDAAGYAAHEGSLVKLAQGMPMGLKYPANMQEQQTTYIAGRDALIAAFSYDNFYTGMIDYVNSFGAVGEFTNAAANAAVDGACSPAGQVVQILATLAIVVLTAPTGGTGGALVSFGAKAAVSAAVGKGIDMALNAAVNWAIDEAMPDFVPNQGPIGGDLSILGSLASANIGSALHGGTRASPKTKAAIAEEIAMEERRDNEHKSIYAKYFDPTNYKTVVGRTIMNTSTDPAVNARRATDSIATVFASAMSLPGQLFGAKASAAASVPDIPGMDYVLLDKATMDIDDVVKNADEVRDMFESGALTPYIGKALTCTGREVGIVNNYMDAVAKPDKRPNPRSKDYHSANCGSNEEAWVKLKAFINSVATAEAEACGSANYDESCQRLGYGGAAAQNLANAAGAAGDTIAGPSKDGWVWPVPGQTRISGPFGRYFCGGSCGNHKGIDISSPGGVPIVAAHDGEIVDASPSCGQGAYIIKATGKDVWYAYQHINTTLPAGTQVKAGQVIGQVDPGLGRCSFGTHLHFSIELGPHISAYSDPDSRVRDPMLYLPNPSERSTIGGPTR